MKNHGIYDFRRFFVSYPKPMKQLFCSLALLISGFAGAQSSYYYNLPFISDSVVREHRIQEVDVSGFRNYGRKSYNYRRILHYDTKGHITYHAVISDSSEQSRLSFAYTFDFRHGSEIPANTLFQENKDNGAVISDFNPYGRQTAKRYYNRNGRLTYRYTFTYQDSLLTRQDKFNGRGRLKTYYLYTWQAGKMQSSAIYNRKGKLMKYWDYACDDAGKSMQKQPDTVRICKSTDYRSDGSRVVTTQTFDYRGDPLKYITVYDSLDRAILYLTYFTAQENLGYREEIIYNGQVRVRDYKMHASRYGKKLISYSRSYGSDGKLIAQTDSSFIYKTPRIETFTFAYNTRGLVTLKTGMKGGVLNSREHFIYTFRKND